MVRQNKKKHDAEEQRRQLRRVKIKIEDLVYRFCKMNEGMVINMEKLDGFVRYNSPLPVTPGSAGRILRLLRAEGVIDYEVINRRDSLYLIRRVK